MQEESKRKQIVDESYDDIPDEMEDIIELLLNGLQDKDTIVRWSSAKGIGRICTRIPREVVDDIIASILEITSSDVEHTDSIINCDVSCASECSWHGSSLALAELARRGLLLPEKLYDAVPWMLRVCF